MWPAPVPRKRWGSTDLPPVPWPWAVKVSAGDICWVGRTGDLRSCSYDERSPAQCRIPGSSTASWPIFMPWTMPGPGARERRFVICKIPMQYPFPLSTIRCAADAHLDEGPCGRNAQSDFYVSSLFDEQAMNLSPEEKDRATGLIELLTPVVKAYCAQRGFEVCVQAMQTFGGYGYTSEYPWNSWHGMPKSPPFTKARTASRQWIFWAGNWV